MANIEKVPKQIRDDVEDKSLDILQHIQQYIVVIGGWAVRSYATKSFKHARYTLDIDAVATPENIKTLHDMLVKEDGMFSEKTDWGIKFYKPYRPNSEISYDPSFFKDLQIRIEILPPRIYEIDKNHYFEFNLKKTTKQIVISHGIHKPVWANVPEIEYLTVNKLGLPADYKNRYDAAVLLSNSDFSKIFEIIKKTDKWEEMILRRLPKFIARTKDKKDIAHMLLQRANIDISDYLNQLISIKQKLEK